MDIEICKTKNPLVRDGTSQQQRWLKQLHPRYARIDDKSLADLLNFANHYSRELQYFDNQDQADGDWHAFFDSDLACIIAAVANKDNQDYKNLLYQLKSYLNEGHAPEVLLASGVLETLQNFIFQLAYEINAWVLKARTEGGFKQHLHRLLTSELAQSLTETVSSYNALQTLPPPKEQDANPHQLPSFNFNAAQVHNQVFSALWQTDAGENWKTLKSRFTSPEPVPTPGDPLSQEQKALVTASSESLALAAQLFLQAQNQLINATPGYLFHLIHHNDDHKPHIALFIAFTRLYKFAQIHINSLTGKHLDFYYRDILGFKPHPATKDRVHLLFELAKSPKHHKLEQGTLFNAGFDDDGKPVHYALNNELVVNKAVIKEDGDIKSVFIDKNLGMPVFGAAVANSSDGKGKAFATPEPRWKPFGQSQLADGELKSPQTRTGEAAELGFAISSPLLDLREGERTINLKLYEALPDSQAANTSNTSNASLSPELVKVNLSGEKEWLEARVTSFRQQSGYLELIVKLSLDQAAVTPFDPKVLTGRDYQSRFPVMQVILHHTHEKPESPQQNQQSQQQGSDRQAAELARKKTYAYQALKDMQVTGLVLDVEVTGVKNLIVQSDLGVLDGNKPFLPFGPKPVLAGAFYIGCDEAFRKPVTSVSLSASWQGAPASFTEHYKAYYDDILPAEPPRDPPADQTTVVITEAIEPQARINEDNIKASISVLNNYAWEEKQSELVLFNKTLTDDSGQTLDLPQYNLSLQMAADPGSNQVLMPQAANLDKLTGFNNSLAQGFIRLSLKAPLDVLGHKRYSRVYSKRVIQQINHPDLTLIPNEPYTPMLQDISLNYQAKTSAAVSQLGAETQLNFYHIYPFGSALAMPETAADTTAETETGTETAASLMPLMPRFVTREDGQLKQNRGEMYIGLSDTSVPQLVTLFFQVAEGSADPRFNKETIHWSVLINNQWQPLTAKEVVTDSTNAFNTSGIVAITLPGEASSNNTLLPPGKIWLRAAVLEQPTAVCDLITVSTQAGEASFSDNNNHQEFLASPLPADTISKLKVKQSAIKGISQPYAGVEGKAGENDTRFNIRVSQRLRHKDRAITLWDYEHLVLQAFDDIYKVKCINHSTYLYPKDSETLLTSEFAPGYVTVVVIADLSNKNAIDPLEPRASLDKLDKIKSFLQQRMTPWAAEKLRVLNPTYEAIQLEFNVTFHSGFDPGLYTETLNRDLMEFLSPWAFGAKQHTQIHFGGKIHRSVLVNFIEQREYVDYLTEVKMHQHLEPPPGTPAEAATSYYDIEEATPGSARSIFVSHKKHLITAGGSCK
ncbi:hypothetical protein SG34_015800 [Thalassomonas viridans]|uniref:Baseplate protein J-like domain-containing protein n=1 Tax=Thalassomonas viridans TaxID=137584 RepID=A0AAE9YX45_9GAMM|nr:hypothetical protein [Thalassomonas viridans]WDE02906.1 hypothetical protein SG34_015800 [Thalassomonas viridans]